MNNKKSFGVDELSSLPSSWCCATLDELMKKIVDGTHHTPTYIEEGVPFLSVKDIRNGEIYFDNCKYISQEEHKELCKRCSPEYGDLLITKSGTIGRCAVVKTKRDFSLFVSVALLKPAIQEVNISYISLAFQSWFQNINVQNDVTGTAIKNFHLVDFRRLALPIAPLNEQKRIVGKIEALQKRSQRVKEAIDAIPQLLDQFRQSVLAAAFRGDLTADWRENNPDVEPASVLLEKIRAERRRKWEEAELEKMKAKGKIPKDDKWKQKYKEAEAVDDSELSELPQGWEWVPVELISTKVVDGVHKKPNYVINGIPFVTVKNLTAGSGISFEEIKYVSIEDHEEFFKRANPQRGDILITKDGTLGVVRVIRTDKVFSIFVSVALVKPIFSEMSDYMELAFSCPQMQRQMLGVGIGLMHIHLRELRRYSMPIAPLEEQKEIVCQIQSFFKTIDTIQQQYQETKANLDQLNQSILAKAFRGELVPQNPNDEPASILLERIRAEREKLQQQTKAAKKSKGKTTKRRSKKAPQQVEEAIQLELPGMEE